MRIGTLDLAKRVLLVAEIGNNHEGDLDAAKEMVRSAAACGAGAVKFQTFRTRDFVRSADRARYARMEQFELSPAAFGELSALARHLGLLFISTPLDLPSVDVLEPLVDALKIASGDNDHYPLIESVCATGRPLIVSTGLADLAQVQRTVSFVQDRWRALNVTQELAVLHCVTSYPVPPDQANVAAVPTLASAIGQVVVGYSDHTIGTEACIAAVTLGARVIEKHFTLDKRRSDFRDHQMSADPADLAELVRRIEQVEELLGTGHKDPQPAEAAIAREVRRSIVAAANLPRGHILVGEDLTWMRPADGLRPGQEHQIIGRPLRRAFTRGETIQIADVE